MGKSVIFGLIFLFLAMNSTVFAYEFCDNGIIGERNLRIISVDDMLKQNLIEWTWEPKELVEIEARVENREDYSNDYILEIVFLDDTENTINLAKNNDNLEIEFSLAARERESILIEFEVDEDFKVGKYNMVVKMYKKGDENIYCIENSKIPIIINKVELCNNENVKISDLEITNIFDKEKDNSDRWEWEPGNDIAITLNLENKDYKKQNFIVELVIFDKNNEEISFTKNNENLKEEKTLEEGEEGDFDFDFKIKNEMDEGVYLLYAKAYSEDNENICTSIRAEDLDNKIFINVNRINKKVIVSEVDGPTNAPSDSILKYFTTVINMGSNMEEKVAVIAYNRILGIRETIVIDDLGSGEEETVEFNIKIPLITKLGSHKIIFSTEYEYDEKLDFFRGSSDEEDDKKIILSLKQGEFEKTGIEKNSTKININKTKNISDKTVFEESEYIKKIKKVHDTTFTGNVIGKTSKPVNWFGILIFITLAGVGVFLFLKKPKVKKDVPIITPNVIRRYVAKLN